MQEGLLKVEGFRVHGVPSKISGRWEWDIASSWDMLCVQIGDGA